MNSKIYIGAEEFHYGLPAVVHPFGDKQLPALTLSAFITGQRCISSPTGKVTLNADDVLCYDKNTGNISRISGPSYYHGDIFRKMIAETRLGQSILDTNYKFGISVGDNEVAFYYSDEDRSWTYDDISSDKYKIIVLKSRQSNRIHKIYTRLNAIGDIKAEQYLARLLEKLKRKPSGAFKYYENQIRKDELDRSRAGLKIRFKEIEEFGKRSAAKETIIKAFAKLDLILKESRMNSLLEVVLDSGIQVFEFNGHARYIVHQAQLYKRFVTKKNLLKWEDHIETLDRMAFSIQYPEEKYHGKVY